MSVAYRVLEACPNITWKLIFALARFGGLRCPSEVVALRWEHILWNAEKIHVPCVKTTRYEGREWRDIPIFPELRPLLEEARSGASTQCEWVIDAYRNPNANPGVQFARILKKANIAPWPKLMQNLRFTRAQELIDEGFPENVVQAWIGNSDKVAKEHYRTVREEHFQRATGSSPKSRTAKASAAARVKTGSPRVPNNGQQDPNPTTPGRSDRNNSRGNRGNNPNRAGDVAPANARERT